MSTSIGRHITLRGTCNLRDLGGYPVAGGNSLGWRRVLRSDSLHDLDAQGMASLIDSGVASIVDLRDTAELERQPNPFSTHRAVRYTHIPLFSNLDLQTRLRIAQAEGDVLLALYCDVLMNRQSALSDALRAIADARPGGVLFHCTVGKDRTGVLAALVLAAVGASAEDIIADYALSAARIGSIRERMMADFLTGGADAASLLPLFLSNPATMRGMLDYLDRQYGGINAYLRLLDKDLTLCEKLRTRMLC
ncbi:MAG: protein tyrosine phosphatase [Herbaspirillum sp.]|jgi:protein-tyrosine phosphatase|nr:protein tyrosine phosphatase [Herbaspirillum sp.]